VRIEEGKQVGISDIMGDRAKGRRGRENRKFMREGNGVVVDWMR
jgi:hypothetical protein